MSKTKLTASESLVQYIFTTLVHKWKLYVTVLLVMMKSNQTTWEISQLLQNGTFKVSLNKPFNCYKIILVSKNVVGENGEWQLWSRDCTTKRNCVFHIWYAKTMSSLCGAKLILPYEWPIGSGLTSPFIRNLEIIIAFQCPFTNA